MSWLRYFHDLFLKLRSLLYNSLKTRACVHQLIQLLFGHWYLASFIWQGKTKHIPSELGDPSGPQHQWLSKGQTWEMAAMDTKAGSCLGDCYIRSS